MNVGHKHFSRWSFGDTVWHKLTKHKGMILGIQLRSESPASYDVVFEDNRSDMICLEMELTDEQPSPVEIPDKT